MSVAQVLLEKTEKRENEEKHTTKKKEKKGKEELGLIGGIEMLVGLGRERQERMDSTSEIQVWSMEGGVPISASPWGGAVYGRGVPNPEFVLFCFILCCFALFFQLLMLEFSALFSIGEVLEAALPIPTHCFLQVAAHCGLELKDFLPEHFPQGREHKADALAAPAKELRGSLGIARGKTSTLAQGRFWSEDSTSRVGGIGVRRTATRFPTHVQWSWETSQRVTS